jgi:hypothetical protein
MAREDDRDSGTALESGPPEAASVADGQARTPRDKLPHARDFFISYNREDRDWAEWVAWQLESAGYLTYLQDWDFPPGESFVQNMHDAVINSRRMIAVLSPTYLTSGFTSLEWEACIAKDPSGALLVPVRVRPCRPDGLLAVFAYIDLVGSTLAWSARRKLLAGLDPRSARSSFPPGMPTPDRARPMTATSAPPPWPPWVGAMTRLVAAAAARTVRLSAIALVIAIGAWIYFGIEMPGFRRDAPRDVAIICLACGVAMIGVIEFVPWLVRRCLPFMRRMK